MPRDLPTDPEPGRRAALDSCRLELRTPCRTARDDSGPARWRLAHRCCTGYDRAAPCSTPLRMRCNALRRAMSLLSGGYPSRGCSLACFSMRRHGGEQAQWAVRSPMERRAKSQSNITAAGWKHTAKAVSEPRRQRNARQRQCLSSEGSGKHEAKAVSEPRRQWKHTRQRQCLSHEGS